MGCSGIKDINLLICEFGVVVYRAVRAWGHQSTSGRDRASGGIDRTVIMVDRGLHMYLVVTGWSLFKIRMRNQWVIDF